MLTKEDAEKAFKSIKGALKGLFISNTDKDKPEENERQQEAFAGATVAYNVTDAAPVYVEVADSNSPAIAQGSNVYADATGTTQYPDGTYTIAGTQFSFTVTAGVVSLVVDPAGAGPGTPIQPTQPQPVQQQQPIVQPPVIQQPVQQPQMLPRFNIQLPKEFSAFKTLFESDKTAFETEASYSDVLTLIDKFAVGTTEERIVNLEVMAKALMMYCFGYQLQDLQAKQAINAYTTTVEGFKSQVAEKDKQIETLKDSSEKLIALFEQFMDMTPQADPATLSQKNKSRFDSEKETRKDALRDRIALNLKAMRTER